MKTWTRWCAIGLFISGSGMALGSALFGHTLIDVLYEGATGTFLDRIITGQHVHPVEHYYAVADQRILTMSVALCLLNSLREHTLNMAVLEREARNPLTESRIWCSERAHAAIVCVLTIEYQGGSFPSSGINVLD
jgi:hypothetical protein